VRRLAMSEGTSRTGWKVATVLIVASTIFSVLAGEIALRLLVNPGDFLLATLKEDPVLGFLIAPHSPGHDALGFRNREVAKRAAIVAIGDSVTYGVSAPADKSWPRQLEALLGKPVYSMAVGGFGPMEYLHLAETEARKLGARVVLVGLYLGNDLADAHRAVYMRNHWESWRDAAAASGDKPYATLAEDESPKRLSALRDWLARHSVLYSTLKATVLQSLALWEKDRIARRVDPQRQMIWVDPSAGSVRTIFTPQLRLAALDPSLGSVVEGMRITKRALLTMKNGADKQGIALVVILIPTKERAYCNHLRKSGQKLPGAFDRLCDAEETVKEDIARFMTANAIRHVDVTGALEERIAKHVAVYPRDTDGHPNATGYSVIARAVHDRLRLSQ
jgi:lysophospholipase L1-like esterase